MSALLPAVWTTAHLTWCVSAILHQLQLACQLCCPLSGQQYILSEGVFLLFAPAAAHMSARVASVVAACVQAPPLLPPANHQQPAAALLLLQQPGHPQM